MAFLPFSSPCSICSTILAGSPRRPDFFASRSALAGSVSSDCWINGVLTAGGITTAIRSAVCPSSLASVSPNTFTAALEAA